MSFIGTLSFDDAQVKPNRMIRMVTDAKETQAKVMPTVMFNEDAGLGNPAPEFGEHTDEILRKISGFDQARIAQMRASGAVA